MAKKPTTEQVTRVLDALGKLTPFLPIQYRRLGGAILVTVTVIIGILFVPGPSAGGDHAQTITAPRFATVRCFAQRWEAVEGVGGAPPSYRIDTVELPQYPLTQTFGCVTLVVIEGQEPVYSEAVHIKPEGN